MAKNVPRGPEKALPSPFLPFIISSRLAWTGGGGTPHLRFPFLPPPSVGAATAKIFRNLKFLPLLTSLSSSLQKIVVLHTPSEAVVCMPPLQLCLCMHGALLPLSYALYKSLPTYLFPKKNLSFPRRTAAEGGKIKGGMFEIPSKIDTSPDYNAQSLLEEAQAVAKGLFLDPGCQSNRVTTAASPNLEPPSLTPVFHLSKENPREFLSIRSTYIFPNCCL